MDWYMAKFMPPQEQTQRPNKHEADALHQAGQHAGREHGDFDRDHMVRSHSLYNTLARHPIVTTGVAVAVGAAVIGLLRFMNERPTTSQRVQRRASDAIDSATKAARSVAKSLHHKNRGFFN
jgi:hypothetical protein